MPPFLQSPSRIRPLPRTCRPVPYETIDSYVARLAAANAIPARGLQTYLDARPSQRAQALLHRLAAASRQPLASLSRALVEFEYLGTGTGPQHYQTPFPRQARLRARVG